MMLIYIYVTIYTCVYIHMYDYVCMCWIRHGLTIAKIL